MTIQTSQQMRRQSLTVQCGRVLAFVFVLTCLTPTSSFAQRIQLGQEDHGLRARVGFRGGDTVGRLDSLTHFEVMPYLRTPNGMLFGDARFFVGDGEVGGNVGVGYRELIPELNRIFGGIVWYDMDNLSGEQAQQITVSLETYGSMLDAMANIYIPLGDEEVGSLRATNERFSGNRLLYDQIGTIGEVLGGGDIQIGTLLPGELAASTQLRAFIGAYHYMGSSVDDITGVMGRLEGTFFDMVDGEVKITNDDTFGSNLLVGISIGLNREHRGGKWRTKHQDPITRYPTRQYNAVVVDADVTRTGLVASNPETGNAYSFSHVASGVGGARTGTLENPFDSIQDALAENSDFYIVRGNSVFTGADAEVDLNTGDRLFGNSADFEHSLTADGVGSVILPTILADSTAPILRGTAGNTVRMASDSELRGFTIENSGRSGVVLNGVDNALVSNVTVLDAVRNGVQVSNISGSVSVLDTTVETSGGPALLIENVTGSVVASGSFTNDSGEALMLDNIGEDAKIDLMDASFSNDTGNGLAFSDVGGSVALSAISLLNSSANGIQIDGGTGTIKFAGETVIDGAAGDAIRMHNSDAQVEFDSLTIRNANGNGISVFNNANTATFKVNGLTSIDGATNGIRIRQNEGTVDFDKVEIDGRRLHGIRVDETEGQVNFNGTVTINNSDAAGHSAVEITNSSADVLFVDKVEIADATGDAAVHLENNTGVTGFINLDIDAQDGAGVVARSAGTIRILDGNVAVEDGSAFDIEDAETTVSLTSLSSTNAAFGIRLKDHSGDFVVNGIADVTDSGGFINGATTGVILENAGTFGMRDVVFNENATAISATDADQITIWNGSINDSLIAAANLNNVRIVDFIGTNFSDNVSGVSLQAAEDDTYNWLLRSVTMDGTDIPLIARGTGDSEVTLGIDTSIFNTGASNASVFDISSTNRMVLQFAGNEITSTGDDVTLLDFRTTSTTELAQATVFNNIFETSGTSVNAINVATGGPSELLFSQNTITFDGDRGLGMGFNIAGSATLGLYNNVIIDAFDGATAVLFESIAGPTRVEINGNELEFANLGGLSDRGFIFETITGDVNLIGTVNNLVSGASTPVFVPSGRTTGFFLVNGVQAPQ